MKSNRSLRGLCLVSLVALGACVSTGDGDLETQGESMPKVEIEALPGAHIVDADAAGIPQFLVGDLGAVEEKANVAEVDVRAALDVIAPVFHASPEALVLRKAQSDKIGDQHFRFRQVKNGRDVIGGELLLHVRNGAVYAANGSARDDLDAPVSAKINEVAAIDAAVKSVRGEHGVIEADETQGSAPLAYYRGEERMDLVYKVEVEGVRADQTPLRDSVLINALDGTVVARLPHIHTAKNRQLHNLNGGTVTPGPIARVEGGEANSDAIVNTNYDLLGVVYDCYSTLFARDSFNNAGAKMISSVHYSTNYVNAYWDGTQMVYGDGKLPEADNLAKSMDVTAHELTHAVTEYESNLVYSGESGGLNEAMSDVFGNVCEWYRDGQVVSANTWKVGEDVWTPGTAGDALRYMNDPQLDGGSLDYWTSSAGGVDVHYSSGIANLAFYLLSQGGTHPRGASSIPVTGIGIAKAAQIFYRANRDLLTASSTFAQARTATEQAASQLGYTAAEQAAVTAAWQAVGVGAVPPPVPVALTNGTALTGLTAAKNIQKFYTLTVPTGATNLKFTTSGGTGDVDLYVRFGTAPTTATYDCRPYLTGNAETCTITTIQAGTYHVMLNAFAAYSGLSLLGSFTAPGGGTGQLVINEVEYDEVGTDNGEFVEIFNKGTGAASLTGHTLQFVNGADKKVYLSVDLSTAGSLAAGQYLVVGNSAVSVPVGALRINFASGNDKLQNGAPDGVALVNGATLVDAFSYEGGITGAILTGAGTKSLVEGTALGASVADSNTVLRSLGRFPNGADANNASVDWSIRTTVTPGAANQ